MMLSFIRKRDPVQAPEPEATPQQLAELSNLTPIERARFREVLLAEEPVTAAYVNQKLIKSGLKRDAWATLRSLEERGLVALEQKSRDPSDLRPDLFRPAAGISKKIALG